MTQRDVPFTPCHKEFQPLSQRVWSLPQCLTLTLAPSSAAYSKFSEHQYEVVKFKSLQPCKPLSYCNFALWSNIIGTTVRYSKQSIQACLFRLKSWSGQVYKVGSRRSEELSFLKAWFYGLAPALGEDDEGGTKKNERFNEYQEDQKRHSIMVIQ